MYEQQLRWSVFLVIRCLFNANLIQIPNVDPSVTRRRHEDGGVMWRPGEAQDLISVGLECVNASCWFTKVVETNRLEVFA